MAKYVVPEKYDHVVCPFNNGHVVEAYKLNGHILKCRKQYPEKDFATCPFNSSHIVPASEIRHHKQHCKDKIRIESDFNSTPVVEKANPSQDIPSSEDWGADLGQPSILRRLNADREFKHIVPRSKRSQSGRSNKDIEGWLNGATVYSGLAPDDEWEPPKEGAQKEKIRQPRTKPKGFVNAKNQPKVLNQSLALAGLGRGRPVNQPVLDSSLPSGSTNSSASSVTSSPSRSTESPGREYCMLGRGRGRGRAMAKNISTGPPVGITPLGQNHGTQHTPGRNGDCNTSFGDDASSGDDRTKQIRKFRKKLLEVYVLREHLEKGVQLNADQLQKLQLEEMYKKKLRNLGEEL